ncbi:hypothetical protein DXT91_26525 [Agrobacterium tumefaciens]|uniref:Uncharacterized protein n=6 Tax=Rhizobium/Agrobacterium group TaxID=227290 RepID=A0A2Z2PYI8_RHIRH|nr:hypothetical protein [Rhizobium rhizogenes]ASK41283.1 hypothetical protein [Agrobacterium tumefaciens]ASK43159.1 hypothetical protein [Agrobacterium deltaense]ASK46847.1 hypothetical protein [Agrobacterium radiobacter]ASK47408.1 hypothetical protein [Agrobacterium tomkonis]ASK47528.1 hypothetical protein [Agrobacterium fabrum]KAA6481469.1 hypothetical protein DXT98_27640 [Agrobacterium sp. ICMP 7243]POO48704.1 hypothetical protein CPJ18_25225 [Agrobacterium rosae]
MVTGLIFNRSPDPQLVWLNRAQAALGGWPSVLLNVFERRLLKIASFDQRFNNRTSQAHGTIIGAPSMTFGCRAQQIQSLADTISSARLIAHSIKVFEPDRFSR